MASFDTLPTWINQTFYSASAEALDERDEFVVEFPSYDFQSSPIYLLSDAELRETVLNRTYSIAAIELINDTELLGNLSSTGLNSRLDSFLLLLQGEAVASALSILLAVFLYALSLLTLLGNGIVVYAILTERKLRTVSAAFISLSCFCLFSCKVFPFFDRHSLSCCNLIHSRPKLFGWPSSLQILLIFIIHTGPVILVRHDLTINSPF